MRIAIGIGLILGSVGLVAATGWGQDSQDTTSVATAPAGTISMDLADAGLDDVLKLLSQQAGLNFIAANAVRDKRVTVYLDRVPIQTAIHSILGANNLTLHQVDGANVYVVAESGGRAIALLTKVYTLKFARVLPTVGESNKVFGNTGSLLKPTFTGTSTSGESGSTSGGGSSTSSTSTTTGTGTSGGETSKTQGLVAIIKQLLTDRGSVAIDPRTNSLAVTDVEETFPLVESTLAKLDVKPSQVYLEAEVLEVKRETLHRLGIEYGSSAGTFATFTGPSRQTNFPLGPRLLKQAGAETQAMSTLSLTNLSATLKALETESRVKFLASPRLLTLSNEVAEIRITTDAATSTTSTSQTQTGTITTQFERSTVGTVLRVTPLVTDNRYITMVIEPEISRVTSSATFSSALDPNRRSARTTLMLEDGETAMIAGLLSQDKDLSDRKVPFLSRIPILGAAFTRADHDITDTEIIVFITPHIVKDHAPTPAPSTIPRREQSSASVEGRVADRHRQALRPRR